VNSATIGRHKWHQLRMFTGRLRTVLPEAASRPLIGPRRQRSFYRTHHAAFPLSQLSLVRQRGGNDCGAAALATIAAHHGRSFDYDDLCIELDVAGDGTDLRALMQQAERLGLRGQGCRGTYDAISSSPLPAIAHLRRWSGDGHFVVVHQWNIAHVVLADPGRGLRKLSRESFCRRWTGYLLLIEPVECETAEG
jgi:ABC-type bacteriocin/lantibiotic exporter with double-glycine peptidase domain